MSDSDDLIVSVEYDPEKNIWTLCVYAPDGRIISEPDFIVEIEMWLSNMNRANAELSDPGTLVH